MLCERGRDTEAKVKGPKRSIHVSPDKIGNYTLRMQEPELVEIGPLAPTTGREMWKSPFFPRSKRTACVHAAHKHTVCEREKCYQGNVWNRDFSICGFWGYLCARVCFCATICRLHTNLASASCRKFFTCFLIEPHLPQAQTHIWTHRLEKISKPATHRDCESQRTFQIDHKSNAQRALCLTGYTTGYRGQKGSFCWALQPFRVIQPGETWLQEDNSPLRNLTISQMRKIWVVKVLVHTHTHTLHPAKSSTIHLQQIPKYGKCQRWWSRLHG